MIARFSSWKLGYFKVLVTPEHRTAVVVLVRGIFHPGAAHLLDFAVF